MPRLSKRRQFSERHWLDDHEYAAPTERAHKADKPFFVWFNTTRMHVFTHLRPESVGKIGKGSWGTALTEARLSRAAARGRAAELLDRVGIPPRGQILDSHVHQLSGGMRQRVMIAMAICCGPALLIADEPTTALDVTIQAQVLDLLAQMRSELGLAMLYITHDLEVVAKFCESTTGRLVLGLVEPTGGRVLFRVSGPRAVVQVNGCRVYRATFRARRRSLRVARSAHVAHSHSAGAKSSIHTFARWNRATLRLVICWSPSKRLAIRGR